MKEVAATPMSIIFTRVQISLPVFQLGMEWPQWLLDLQVRSARAATTILLQCFAAAQRGGAAAEHAQGADLARHLRHDVSMCVRKYVMARIIA